jgi:hypothetical protein
MLCPNDAAEEKNMKQNISLFPLYANVLYNSPIFDGCWLAQKNI